MEPYKAAVRDWMTPDPITVKKDVALINAYDVMRKHNIRRLPVIDVAGMLCGMITRSDIQHVIPFTQEDGHQIEAMFALAGMTVDEIMARDPVSVTPDHPIQAVAQRMIEAQISGVPVVQNRNVVGIITEPDIFRLVVESWAEPATYDALPPQQSHDGGQL